MTTFNATRTGLAAVLISVPATVVFLALSLILAPGIFYVVPVDQPMTFSSRFLSMLGSSEGMTLCVVLLVTLSVVAFLTTAVVSRPVANSATAAPVRRKAPIPVTSGSASSGVTSVASAGEEEGVVKWFNVNKGFGFITRPSGEEIFVHFRNIQGAGRRGLRQGQQVRYTVTQGEKGPQADQVVGLRD